jgi:hypothetical protein
MAAADVAACVAADVQNRGNAGAALSASVRSAAVGAAVHAHAGQQRAEPVAGQQQQVRAGGLAGQNSPCAVL